MPFKTHFDACAAGAKKFFLLILMMTLLFACRSLAAPGRVTGSGTRGEAENRSAANDPSDFTGLFAATSDPLGAALELEAQAVQETLGPEGGTIEIESAAGLTHRLVIPEGALALPTEITVTPLRSLDGIGFEAGLAAGVQLEPHGLSLLQPATLILELPEGVAPDEVWGVSTLAAGEQAALHPILYRDGAVEMPIFGFSSYSTTPGGRAKAENLAERPVTSAGRRALAEMALIFKEHLRPEADLTELPWDQIDALREAWLQQGILPLRERAMDDDIAYLKLEHELTQFMNLHIQLQLLGGGDPGFMAQLAELWIPPALAAQERAIDRCKREHRLGEIGYALELQARIQLLDSTEASSAFDEVLSCLHFRVAFESTITSQSSSSEPQGSKDELFFVAGSTEPFYGPRPLVQLITASEDSGLTWGQGTLEYEAAEGGRRIAGEQGGVLQEEIVGAQDAVLKALLWQTDERPRRYGPWSVPEIYGPVKPPPDPDCPDADPEECVVEIQFDPGDPTEQREASLGDIDASGTSHSWDFDFTVNHLEQQVEPYDVLPWAGGASGDPFAQPPVAGFAFRMNFEGGRRYASYEYDECEETTLAGGWTRSCERTFITLYHEPEG